MSLFALGSVVERLRFANPNPSPNPSPSPNPDPNPNPSPNPKPKPYLGRRQDGVEVNDVSLPPWAHGSPRELARQVVC